MPSNLDKLFFGKIDFANYRDFSQNITEGKLDAFIREAQTIEARGFLGAELYAAMQEDFDGTVFTEQRFIDLWLGVDTTEYKYNGYQPAAIYFAYARMLGQQQTNVSRFGVESVQNEISEDISIAQVRGKLRDAQEMAFSYQNRAATFIQDNIADYPEYNDNTQKPRKTTLNFFKVN
jgi:hypothetical protein